MRFRRNAIHGNASPEERTNETERAVNGRLKENDKRTNNTIRYDTIRRETVDGGASGRDSPTRAKEPPPR